MIKAVEGTPKRSAMWIVKNLGLLGLYKGASACLLRDGKFSCTENGKDGSVSKMNFWN